MTLDHICKANVWAVFLDWKKMPLVRQPQCAHSGAHSLTANYISRPGIQWFGRFLNKVASAPPLRLSPAARSMTANRIQRLGIQ